MLCYNHCGCSPALPPAGVAAAAELPPLAARCCPAGSAALATRLTAADSKALEQLWDGVSTLVLDCDGVLWRGNHLMPGTVEVRSAPLAAASVLPFLPTSPAQPHHP